MKSEILLFIFQLINFFTEWYESFKVLLNRVYNAVSDVYLCLDSIWYFIPYHSLPLPAKSITDDKYTSWKYNSTNNILSYLKSEDKKQNTYKITWLSASIIINDTVHAIDDFISSLKLITSPDTGPDTRIIINCWCITSNIWYSTDDKVSINIIDENGDDIILSLNSDEVNNKTKRDFIINQDCIEVLKHLKMQSTENKYE